MDAKTVSEASRNYFHPFDYPNDDQKSNVKIIGLTTLKMISYITLIVPLILSIIYASSKVLAGRVKPSNGQPSTNNVAEQIFTPPSVVVYLTPSETWLSKAKNRLEECTRIGSGDKSFSTLLQELKNQNELSEVEINDFKNEIFNKVFAKASIQLNLAKNHLCSKTSENPNGDNPAKALHCLKNVKEYSDFFNKNFTNFLEEQKSQMEGLSNQIGDLKTIAFQHFINHAKPEANSINSISLGLELVGIGGITLEKESLEELMTFIRRQGCEVEYLEEDDFNEARSREFLLKFKRTDMQAPQKTWLEFINPLG